MNILPFVTILILVISLTISSFFSGYKECSFAKLGTTGLIHAYRLARNSSEESRLLKFASALQKSDGKEKEKELPKVRKTKNKSFRENITDNSKFNLYPLTQKDCPPFLEEVFTNLIKEIYSETDLLKDYKYDLQAFPKLLTKELLSVLRARNKGDSIEFESIILPNASLHEIWYKMLKGTHSYPDKGSWPSIKQFVLFKESKEKKVISARKAAICVLKAFFGEKITHTILEKEKETDRKKAPLTQEEIIQIIDNEGFPVDKKPFIHYGYKKNIRRTELEKDPLTGIEAEISYRTEPTK
ncbi:MAG: hypothetical protein FJZ59_07080 [Chlamydiae bacterium]|nr:hypothetical protein [Chlamydiota bacterium]